MTRAGGAPPRLTERLLARALAAAPYRVDIIGDLHEAYSVVTTARSARYARWWYRLHALRLAARHAIRLRPAWPQKRGSSVDRLTMQVRYALRSLSKRPPMSATVVATLAFGVGANAAVFGVIDALMLHPYTMRDADRIVMPVSTSPTGIGHRETVSPADFLDCGA